VHVLPRARWEQYEKVPSLSSRATVATCEERCCASFEHHFYPEGRWAPLSLRSRFTPLMGWMRFEYGWVTIVQRVLLCILAAATSLQGRPALCNAAVLFLAAAHFLIMLCYMWYRPLRYPMNNVIFPLSSALFSIVFILKYLDEFTDVASGLQAFNGALQFWRTAWVLWISRREAQWDTEENISEGLLVLRAATGVADDDGHPLQEVMLLEVDDQDDALGPLHTTPTLLSEMTMRSGGRTKDDSGQHQRSFVLPPANTVDDHHHQSVENFESIIWSIGRHDDAGRSHRYAESLATLLMDYN
jgi:hypothetical protein